jgi:nucleoside-diphosphate-sugar epimerase
MRICITGATGFIGSNLALRLSRDGHDVTGLDLVLPGAAQRFDRFVHGDIRDESAVARALQGVEAVFSLAAAHHDFGIAERTYYDVNETGSRVICDQMDRLGIRKVCWYSSCAVYGDCAEPRTENSAPRPNGPYGASKLAGEMVFRQWSASGAGRTALIIRPTITFGPGNLANMYSLIRQIASRRFVVAGRASNKKSLSYVENLVDATLYLWSKATPGCEIFNFIEKPDLTSRQIAETIASSLGRARPGPTLPLGAVLALAKPFDAVTALTGKDLGVSSMRVRKLFQQETCFEASKLAASGFKSKVSLSEGLARMVRWWQEEGSHTAPMWRQPPAEVLRIVP